MEDEKKGSGIKVTDRRRVDEHGDDRISGSGHDSGNLHDSGNDPVSGDSSLNEKPQSDKIQAVPSNQAAQSAISSSEDVHVREDTNEVNFSAFVMSLATQALMQLGQIQPPAGVDLAVDRDAARQTIDIIAMLNQKTKGNLDKDEQHLVDEILNSLRIQFVQKVVK